VAAKIFRRFSEGAAEGGGWGEFRRARALELRRLLCQEQKPAKKFSFPFRRKNPARTKEKQRKLFCWLASVSERRRGESVAVSFKKGSRKV